MLSKILFIGPMGAGKTTAITAVSDIDPISTEAENLDRAQSDKDTTTVAMDYGEIQIDDDTTVLLYGIPGQNRFDFMWPILAEGALGAVLLLDHSRTDAVQQMDNYLDAFPALTERTGLVIGIGKTTAATDVEPYRQRLQQLGVSLPIFAVDVRQRHHVLLLIEALIANAELTESWER